jgi:hypothetical protein
MPKTIVLQGLREEVIQNRVSCIILTDYMGAGGWPARGVGVQLGFLYCFVFLYEFVCFLYEGLNPCGCRGYLVFHTKMVNFFV